MCPNGTLAEAPRPIAAPRILHRSRSLPLQWGHFYQANAIENNIRRQWDPLISRVECRVRTPCEWCDYRRTPDGNRLDVSHVIRLNDGVLQSATKSASFLTYLLAALITVKMHTQSVKQTACMRYNYCFVNIYFPTHSTVDCFTGIPGVVFG